MKRTTLFLILLLGAQTAYSAVFDFVSLIETDTNIGTLSGEYADGSTVGPLTNPTKQLEDAYKQITWQVDGITLMASASLDGNTNGLVDGAAGGDIAAYAYLDKKSGGKFAGLGVCAAASTKGGQDNQCTVGSGDNAGIVSGNQNTPNVGLREFLTLEFDREVSVDFGNSTFRDDDHYLFTDSSKILDMLISIDGGAWAAFDPLDAAGVRLVGTRFDLRTAEGEVDGYYIDSLAGVHAVPIPPSALLFGSALLGFAGIRRRKKQLGDQP
ncbi:MAG: VPLPA-CTERM sorting domain-containing protein [Candidatus Sedimenticola sp. (ex Thyasira tokunagai)]